MNQPPFQLNPSWDLARYELVMIDRNGKRYSDPVYRFCGENVVPAVEAMQAGNWQLLKQLSIPQFLTLDSGWDKDRDQGPPITKV